MLREFKNYVQERINILKLNIIYTFQNETSSVANSWGNILSTTMYTLTYILFINILYTNVKTFAGYTKDETLFMILIAQLNVFLNAMWSHDNIDNLIDDVRVGNLDLILCKPIPSLFYLTLRDISIVSIIRDLIPPFTAIMLSINWTNIHLTFQRIITGVIIFFSGQLAFHSFEFILGLSVFWLGKAENIKGTIYALDDTKKIPFEGYPFSLKILFTLILPVLITSQVATSVLLGKSNAFIATGFSLTIALLFFYLKIMLWQKALKRYTSVSS